MSAGQRWSRDEEGQALPLLAVILTVLTLFLALAINTGALFSERRSAQEAADAGAWGGAIAIQQSLTSAQIIARAIADAALNGYSGPTSGGVCGATVCVDAYYPPISGDHVADSKYVEVVITEKVKGLFLPALNPTVTVTTRAVGGAKANGNGWALISLQGSGTAFDITSGGGIQVNNGNMAVNSTGTSAAKDTGAGNLDLNGGTAQVVGGVSGFSVCPTGAPDCFTTGAALVNDPITGYHKPVCPELPASKGCTGSTVPVISSIDYSACTVACTLSPGFYAVVISPPNNAKVTLLPGLYVLTKGLNISATNVTFTGTGVTFFNTVANYPTENTPPGPCGGAFHVTSGSSTLTLTAPTSGTYKGMLLYQDCNNVITLSAASTVNVASGTVYAPDAQLTLSGNGGTLTVTQLIVKYVHDSAPAGGGPGGAALVVNYDPAKAADSTVGGASAFPYLAE